MSETPNRIAVKPRIIIAVLLVVVALLGLADIITQTIKFVTGHPWVFGLVPKFDLSQENNLPTFFSSLDLAIASLLLGIIAALSKRAGKPYNWHWTLLSLIFLFLSLDEVASLHELSARPTQTILGVSGVFYFAWVIPAGLLLIILGLAYFKFLMHLPSRTRLIFMVAAAMYVGGALGFEMTEGQYVELFGKETLAYSFLVLIEETFEMTGIVVFVYALLDYLRRQFGEIQILVESS